MKKKKRDCCKWLGSHCAKKSGRVINLDLSPSSFPLHDLNQSYWMLRGNISSSLVKLRYLMRLDLNCIYFGGSPIPSFIGILNKLRYLNLSYIAMMGEIPPQLGNRWVKKNLEWLSHLLWEYLTSVSSIWAKLMTSCK